MLGARTRELVEVIQAHFMRCLQPPAAARNLNRLHNVVQHRLKHLHLPHERAVLRAIIHAAPEKHDFHARLTKKLLRN